MQIFAERAALNAGEFVRFWSARYRYPLMNLYIDNIGSPLTEERVLNLYRWKNGTRNISARKLQSIQINYIQALANLPAIANAHAAREYLEGIGGGTVWGIFWLH